MKKAQPQPQIINIGDRAFPLETLDLPKYLSKHKSSDEIKIVYFGTPEFSAYILEKLIEFCQNPPHPLQKKHLGVRPSKQMFRQYTVQTVVTRADKPVGRKQILTESSVAMVAIIILLNSSQIGLIVYLVDYLTRKGKSQKAMG